MTPRLTQISRKKGIAIYLTIIFFGGISLGIALGVTGALTSELRLYESLSTSKRAITVADAAIEEGVYRVAYERPVTSSVTLTQNNASSTVQIVDMGTGLRDFYAVGRSGGLTRKSYAHISKTTNVNFQYGAQIGEGGITLGNNAYVDSTGLYNSNVYSSGPITGAPGAYINGDVTISTGIGQDTASSTSCQVDETVGRTSPNIDYAQSFIMGGTSADTLAKVSFYIKRNNSPANAVIRIMNDNAGVPGSTVLASQSLGASSVATTYGWVEVLFTSPPTLSPYTKYWIVFDSGQHNSKYWIWCRSSGDAYTSGNALYKDSYSSGLSWNAVAGDMTFRVYLGGGASLLDNVYVQGTAKADSITNSTIDQDAYYQTISGTTVSGTSYPGSPTPPEQNYPISSTTVSSWKTEAEAGGVINGNCGTGGVAGCNTASMTLGPVRINGNLLLDNNHTLTISGTVYVTGNVTVSNNGAIRCSASFGAKSCMLITDGYIDVNNNGTFSGSGTAGSFVLALTTLNGCLGSGAGCATGGYGINVANNVSGALFYAGDSMVSITNGATVTAVVASRLNISNNAAVIFDDLLMSAIFTSNATSTISGWDVNQWSEFQ